MVTPHTAYSITKISRTVLTRRTVPYGTDNKQQLLLYKILTRWSFEWTRNLLCVRSKNALYWYSCQYYSLTYVITYLLTPMCRVLLEKLIGLQLVKKFPAFHGTRRFITALTTIRHLSLSCASPIQSIYPHPTACRSILILSTHLRLGLPSDLLPSGFPTKTLHTPSPHPYAPHAQSISFFSILSPAQYWVSSTNHCLQSKHPACECFLAKIFYREGLLAPRPTPKLDDHPSSAVRDCLFNLFAATLHIAKWWRTMPWWQGPTAWTRVNITVIKMTSDERRLGNSQQQFSVRYRTEPDRHVQFFHSVFNTSND